MKRFSAIALACAIGAAVAAQSGKGTAVKIPDGDWPNYNRDLAATRYSPLKQITTANIATVKDAWSTTLSAPGGPNLNLTAVPIVIGGVMYVPAGNRVLALDG